MTTQQITGEITRLENLITQKKASANAWKTEGQSWLDSAERTKNCTGTKKQKEACHQENNRKINQGNAYIQRATDLYKEVEDHELRISELRELAKRSSLTDSEVAKLLATQGQTFASVQALAEKQGEAELEKQRTLAQAEAQTVTDKSNTNKMIGYAVIAVLVVGAGIGIVFLVKKLRKNNK